MSTKPINDGGPAFPSEHARNGDFYCPHPGMSLRDWFAAQALMGILAAHAQRPHADLEMVASGAYKAADLMLAAREKAEG